LGQEIAGTARVKRGNAGLVRFLRMATVDVVRPPLRDTFTVH